MPEQTKAEQIADAADLAGGIPFDFVAHCIVHDFTIEAATEAFQQYAATGFFQNGSSSWGEPKKAAPSEPEGD